VHPIDHEGDLARAPARPVLPATLESLLALGREILTQKDEFRRQEEAALLAKRQARWDGLLACAARTLGPLADLLPRQFPDDFRDHGWEYVATLYPFGAAPLVVRFSHSSDNVWRGGLGAAPLLSVPLKYDLRLNYACDTVEVVWTLWEDTDSLPEAVALCQRAEELHARARVECDQRTAQRQEEAAQRARRLSAPLAGERLLAALSDYVARELRVEPAPGESPSC
jgi:hypothetical protein